MRRAPLVVVLVLALGIATAPGAAKQRAAPLATIPFELATRHVMVKARINSSRPLSFVLDTGANDAIVRSDTAKALGLALHGSFRAGGAGAGTMEGHRVRDARWSLDGLEGFSQPLALALPFPALPSGVGQDVDGIIGGRFIQEFVVGLDYQARTLTLHDRKTFTYTGTGHTLPLEFDSNNHPILRATVTPIGGTPIEDSFVLDIGSGAALILHSPFVARHDLPGPAKTVRVIGMAGAGGRSVGRTGRVTSLQIGPYKLVDLPTTFSQDAAGAFANAALAGNIGAQIASRFRLILDYSRRRMILEPSTTFADSFDRPASGLAVRAEGVDYRTFRVREVLEESPGTDAGVREGDIITAVDDARADTFSLTTLLETLTTPGAKRLTLRRGEETLVVTLLPRRLH